jgi:hypothetical protein
MANIPNSPIAQHAAKAFDEMVDTMVMQQLSKNIGAALSNMGVGLADSTALNLTPGMGGQGKGFER